MDAKHILIVEDQPESARVLRDGLQSLPAEFVIHEAGSAEDAIRLLDSHKCDLLIADVRLPGISGLELMEHAQKRNPQTRTILVSGVLDPEIRQQVARAGAHAFFFKPLELADFLDAVERILDLAETALPDEMQVLKDKWAAAEEPVSNIAQYISDLRFNLQAECVALINARGQILARAGALPDAQIETTMMPDLMSAFFAAGRIAAHSGAPNLDDLLIFRTPNHHIHLSSIASSYALLITTQPLQAAQLADLSEAVQKTQARIAPQLARLEITLRPKPAAAEPAVDALGDTDPHLEELLNEAETKPVDRGRVEKYWKSPSEKVLVDPPRGAALTYEQAVQLGLAPVEEG